MRHSLRVHHVIKASCHFCFNPLLPLTLLSHFCESRDEHHSIGYLYQNWAKSGQNQSEWIIWERGCGSSLTVWWLCHFCVCWDVLCWRCDVLNCGSIVAERPDCLLANRDTWHCETCSVGPNVFVLRVMRKRPMESNSLQKMVLQILQPISHNNTNL